MNSEIHYSYVPVSQGRGGTFQGKEGWYFKRMSNRKLWGQPPHDAAYRPETMKTLSPGDGTPRHIGFFNNKPLGVPLCLRTCVPLLLFSYQIGLMY